MFTFVWLLCLMLLTTLNASAQTPALSGAAARNERPGRPEEYWNRLRAACRTCFGGLDVKVELGGGIERREFESGPRTGPFTELRLSIPLYSRSERQKQRQAKGHFLEHGAGLIQDMEEARTLAIILAEKVKVLRQAMLEGGLEAIKEFFKIKEELAKARIAAKGAERKLRGWIESCGHRS